MPKRTKPKAVKAAKSATKRTKHTKLSRKQVAEFLRNEMAGAGASYAAPFYAIVIQYLEEAK